MLDVIPKLDVIPNKVRDLLCDVAANFGRAPGLGPGPPPQPIANSRGFHQNVMQINLLFRQTA